MEPQSSLQHTAALLSFLLCVVVQGRTRWDGYKTLTKWFLRFRSFVDKSMYLVSSSPISGVSSFVTTVSLTYSHGLLLKLSVISCVSVWISWSTTFASSVASEQSYEVQPGMVDSVDAI